VLYHLSHVPSAIPHSWASGLYTWMFKGQFHWHVSLALQTQHTSNWIDLIPKICSTCCVSHMGECYHHPLNLSSHELRFHHRVPLS
jgi:hypothetical protein